MAFDARELIDLARYPIGENGPAREALVTRVQADLSGDGCAVIKSFLTPQGTALLAAEAHSMSDKGHRSFNRTNVYFTKDDPSLPISYVDEPGVVATPERCLQLYGKVLPIHYERAGLRADSYID